MKIEIGLLLALLSTVESRRGGGGRGGGSSRGSKGSSWGSSKGSSWGSSSKSTGWSGNKPTSWGSNTYSNKQYYGGGTSWSKPSKMASLSSMTANPSFASKPFKKKSALSTMKKTAMLAGGAYLAYKVGKAITPDFDMYSYNRHYYYGYNYGPYYGYDGYSYSPYYSSPHVFRGGQYNRYAYKASSCYTCSSIDGSSDKCEYMDSKYGWDQLDDFRKICPTESYCVVTVGRVYPKVNEDPPSISNTTTKEEADKLMSKFEGKAFVKRDCLPIDRMDQNGCKKFPSTEGLDFDYDQESGEIYQCNICDTEACNSWGTDAMPDPRADNSAFTSVPKRFHLLSLTALLLALL